MLTILVFTAGCWPRYADLPEDTDVLDAADDPRSALDGRIAWLEQDEDDLVDGGADNADPTRVTPHELGTLDGLQVAGDLFGVGWNEDFTAPTLEGDSASCTPSSRDTGRQGDWAGDVDFVVVDIADEGSVLCGAVRFEEEQLGWDLLVYPLDGSNCDLPLPPLQADGEVLGFYRRGASGGWKIPLAPGRYGVLLAGYTSPDPLGTYPYHVGLAVVPGDQQGTELCPRLPIEGS